MLKLRVRNKAGEMVPFGSFTTVRDISGPYRVPRFNLYPGGRARRRHPARLFAGPGHGDHGEDGRRDAAAGIGYEWTDLAFQQKRAGNTAIFAFVLGVVFVFLVLAAQFESLTLPLAVILIVPMCLIAVDRRRPAARAGQQHPHPGRLHRADRAGRRRTPF